MTCAHVLGLIDAGPFADYPRAHLEAAMQHARQCATCGPALQAATVLAADLAALPQIAAPPDLAGVVLARIARIEAAAALPVATTDASVPSTERDWWSWATALGGLAAGLAIVLWMPADNGTLLGMLPGVGTRGMLPMPSTTVTAFVLLAGLLLYVRGLFAPFGKK